MVNVDASIVLWPSRAKWLLVASSSLGMAVASASLLQKDGWIQAVAWLGVVLFGLCVVVCMVHLLPGASYLHVTPDGFTFRSLFKAHAFHFADVKEFAVWRSKPASPPTLAHKFLPRSAVTQKFVMFNFEDGARAAAGSPKLREMSVKLSGYEGALPDSYGRTHEELADLLNAYRAAARARQRAVG